MMKICVIMEGYTDRMIRGVTACSLLASKVCLMFPHLNLFFEEFETIDDVTLKNFLDVKKD